VSGTSSDDIRKALVAHQIIFVVFLNLVTLISAVVGGLGLATILTVAITERTCEIGILRSLGATDRALRGRILAEAVTLGMVCWLVAAVALAVPSGWCSPTARTNRRFPFAAAELVQGHHPTWFDRTSIWFGWWAVVVGKLEVGDAEAEGVQPNPA
jgi:hypothetical protein